MFTLFTSSLSFFIPTLQLENGRNIKIIGKGPPVLFSTALYGTMPYQMYNELINVLKSDISVVVFDDFSPVYKDDVEQAAISLNVKQIGFISHLSVDLNILTSICVEKAVLHDPISNTQLSLSGTESEEINAHMFTTIINSENDVQGNIETSYGNIPKVHGEVEYIVDKNVSILDILDTFWRQTSKNFVHKKTNIDKSKLSTYKDCILLKKEAPQNIQEYKNIVSKRIVQIFKT